MGKTVSHLKKEFLSIRAGKATPSILNSVNVDYYGATTPLSQVANVNTPDAKTLSIQPWEKNILQPIEKAILDANIGLTPMNNGELIIINLPPVTEERRKELVKQAKGLAEETKITIRNTRYEANKEIKKMDVSEDMKKNAEIDIQELTDDYISKTEEVLTVKEKEILTV
ncbi:ribosome-recycling factor [Elysia marginata]|uniref:Ribosome-recycling factor, mitochondrial n=1 Tax=Elysia marginata TaxID=1093978 RepID=A0AAV4FNX6_9GAST|nr:ribosome-recycling factor [Elysia marginata]